MTRAYTRGDLNSCMNSLSMGFAGSNLIDDANAHTGDWDAVLVLTECAFTTLTTTNVYKNGDTTLAVASDWGTVSAGTVLYGNFTTITLASGSVQAFKKFEVGEV